MRLIADLTYRYPSGFTVGPVQLDLGPGVHRLVGPNGAGKTTLLRCLCAHHRASTGTLSIDGLDPRTSVEGRRRVAFVAAEPELPDVFTVTETWRQLAAIRGMPHWDGETLRQALDVPADLLLGHCSAGQRKLAELLAGLAADPVVLLLDEPFANLDADHTLRLVQVLEGLRSERVVLLTTHEAPPLSIDIEVGVSRTLPGPGGVAASRVQPA
jgi:ABC-2 type transport system ATP-binding protein